MVALVFDEEKIQRERREGQMYKLPQLLPNAAAHVEEALSRM